MTKSKKRLAVVALACALMGTSSIIASAYSASYSVSSSNYLVSVTNDTANSKTLSCNTRPSSGTGGAHVKITKSDGTVVASKDFPFYVSTTDLTASVPSGNVRRIYVGPATSGQTVTGTLYYEF